MRSCSDVFYSWQKLESPWVLYDSLPTGDPGNEDGMSTSSAGISGVLLCRTQRGNYYTLFVYFHIACRFFFIHLILRVKNSILRQLTIFRCFLFFLRYIYKFLISEKTIGEACEVLLLTVIKASEIIASETTTPFTGKFKYLIYPSVRLYLPFTFFVNCWF